MRLRVVTLALVVLMVLAAAGGVAYAKPAKPLKVKVYPQGQVYCPASALVAGGVVIRAGRCYTLYVIREQRGTFLAFAEPQVFIPPGQIVRLTTPAGAKAKAKILYLVPIQTRGVLVPVNAMTPVAVRVEDFGPQVIIVLTSVSVPNVALIFQVRL